MNISLIMPRLAARPQSLPCKHSVSSSLTFSGVVQNRTVTDSVSPTTTEMVGVNIHCDEINACFAVRDMALITNSRLRASLLVVGCSW